MSEVFLVTSAAEQRGSRTRSPSIAFGTFGGLMDFLRREAAMRAVDPDNEELMNLDTTVVFRMELRCFYFANAPLAVRDLLAGAVFPE